MLGKPEEHVDWENALPSRAAADAHGFSPHPPRRRPTLRVKRLTVGMQDLRSLKLEAGRSQHEVMEEIDTFLDRFVLSRIGIEMLNSQYLSLFQQSTGIADPHCDPCAIARKAARFARKIASEEFPGSIPEVDVTFHGKADARTLPLVPSYLMYILMELLKNSVRAVAEQHQLGSPQAPVPPIVIRVASDESQVVMDIFDRGGGIPFPLQQKVWSYMYSTRRGTRGAVDSEASEATPLAGFGVGLPLSRLYAEYIGGSLQLVSMPNFGTHAFLFLERSDSRKEGMPTYVNWLRKRHLLEELFDIEARKRPGHPKDLAPQLSGKPGAQVKPSHYHEAPHVLDVPKLFATETRTLVSAMGKFSSVSLERFGPAGVHHFFNSAMIFDWCLFFVAACVAVVYRRFLAPASPHASLMGWLALGAVYALVIFLHMGSHHGSNWLAGYFLELIFLVENVFVFHGIGEAFWASPKQVSRCLVLVAWAQIFFDVVFYMGLAEWLRSWIFLPYLLGLWLLSLGVSVLGHETAGSPAGSPVPGGSAAAAPRDTPSGAASDSSEAPSSPAADMLRNVMGSRLDMDGHCCLGPCLALAKPLLGLGWKQPTEEMLSCFPLLHYGIGVILCIFGLQMLLQDLLVIEPLISCALTVLILAACVVTSAVRDHWRCPEQQLSGRS
eukprot:g13365.t1